MVIVYEVVELWEMLKIACGDSFSSLARMAHLKFIGKTLPGIGLSSAARYNKQLYVV